MSSYKPSVLITGPNGTVGSNIVKAILKKKDNLGNIGFLAREESPRYDSLKSQGFQLELKSSGASAIKGKYDIYVICLAATATAEELELVKFAVEAGIKTIYPSEYGFDTDLLRDVGGPFAPKIEVLDYLKKKNEEGVLDYVKVLANSFFDWGIEAGGFWGFDLKNKEAIIFDGGDYKVSWTYLPDLGELVVESFFDKSIRNTSINVTSFVATQEEILKEFEKQTNSEWKRIDTSLSVFANEKTDDHADKIKRFLNSFAYSKELAVKFNARDQLRYDNEVKVHSLAEVISALVKKSS
ncbi:hypothetical protein CLIB1423_36S00188 [[Candida] railenensis]|uniref:NmrA-like domain-containing protein n=1 Tax=[Candida] railenensis TaxID=45579 RepID=A0A9P0QWI4_9ASCO|nr:hypothetical protein CLIB1423_36S00188 [[Candida] railenensis]